MTELTPTIAALYGARREHLGIDQALDEVGAALRGIAPDREFDARLHR